MTGDDKGKHPEENKWVYKALEKEVGFYLECTKETFMDAKKSFAEASTLGNQNKVHKTNMPREVNPSVLTTFLETCMKLMHDRKVVKGLQELINKCVNKENALDGHYVVRKIGIHKARTGREMRFTMQIGEYEMDQVILDLRSDAKFLPKQTWERMGRPTLQWSLIQLRMAHQQNIIPMGRLYGVAIDIEGVSTMDDFELIQIIDDINPYPVLLRIDWAIDMIGAIKLNKRTSHLNRNHFELQCRWTLKKGRATLSRSVTKKIVRTSQIRSTK